MKNRIFKGALFVFGLFLIIVSHSIYASYNSVTDEQKDTSYNAVSKSTGAQVLTGPTLTLVSYGTISSSGTVINGYGIDSVSNPSTGRFEIEFTDFDYYYADYVTVATAIGVNTYNVTTTSIGGDTLVVYITDADGDPVNYYFNFIVYEPGD
jgi:hypothetical protein